MSRRRWLVPLALLAVAAAFFWKLAPAPDGFLYRPNSEFSDLTITHWPNALYIRQMLAEYGQVPLWRSLILGGEPFAANPLSGLWYPPFWLLLVLPLTPAFNLLFVLHMAWAGWGACRLARSTGASLWGGLLAALVVMLAPKAVAHLAAGHVGLYCAWAWLPWVVWAVRRLAEKGRAADVATAAAAAAMLILADVRLGFYGALAAAGYWAATGGGGTRRPGGGRRWLPGLAAALLAAALVAVQVVPLAAVAGRLNRGGLSLAESGIASLPPRYLLGLLVADHGGFQEWMTYVGAVGLLLALVGLARWRARERWLWGTLALTAAVYSLGVHTPFYPLLYRLLPPLSWLRGPARAWFLVVLATAVLAAQGLTALEGSRADKRARLYALALAVAALTGGVAGAVMRLPANVVIAAALWPAAGALALLAGRRLFLPAQAALVLLALVDLALVGSTLYRVRPAAEVLAEGAAAAEWLAAQARPFRVYSPSYSIPQHTGAVYGIETVDGVDPFQLADYAAFMRQATGVDIPGYSVTIPSFPPVGEGEEMLLAHRGVQPDLERLGRLNVRYLAAAFPMDMEGLKLEGVFDGVYLYRNELARPRVWVEGQTAPVEVLLWSPNRIEVEAEGPGLLLLSEVDDPDWRARVDGQAVEIVRVDGILRGVPLEARRHRIALAYWPAGLSAGLALSALGWLTVAILWGVRSKTLSP